MTFARRRNVSPSLAARALVVAAALGGLAACTGPSDAAFDPSAGEAEQALSLTTTLSEPAPTAPVVQGILSFAYGPPTQNQLKALCNLGILTQGLDELPLAIVRGTAAQISAAVSSGIGLHYYPDDPLEYSSVESNGAIGVTETLHAGGLTGKGRRIAVVDTGIDGTHPDFQDRVVHNVMLVGPEVAKLPSGACPGYIVAPMDQGPYSNTDLGQTHGTMVAGVIAANGVPNGRPSQVGVAPEAELIGYAAGAGLSVTNVLAAYDQILKHQHEEDWRVDVVNNSWGNKYWEIFDPDHPIQAGTKALTDAGIAVVFSAGNNGQAESEMTQNSRSFAPWNIAVAASGLEGARADFSSNGLEMDNSDATPPTNGHVRYVGDRIGIYHPTLTAPGVAIETSCAPAGLCGPTGTDKTGTTDGTSFAAPHVSGVIALMRQAQPGLTVGEARQALSATARKPATPTAFWMTGYGIVDAPAALALVQKPGNSYKDEIKKAYEKAQARVLADRDWRVSASDHWMWPAPLPSVAGVIDHRQFKLNVPAGADAVKLTLAIPSVTPSLALANYNKYTATVYDAAGTLVGKTAISSYAGLATALLDLPGRSVAFGEWTLEVRGERYAMDANNYVYQVTLQAAVLEAQQRVSDEPQFVADADLPFAFVPDPDRASGLVSPEGCALEAGAPLGLLGPSPTAGVCHSGLIGWFTSTSRQMPAMFTSSPVSESFLIGGKTDLIAYITDPPRQPGEATSTGALVFVLDEIDGGGTVHQVDSGTLFEDPVEGRNEASFQIDAHEVRAGNRLRLSLAFRSATTSAARLLFGGDAYGDAGIRFTRGHLE